LTAAARRVILGWIFYYALTSPICGGYRIFSPSPDLTMPVTIQCPHCDKQLRIQEANLGKQVRCPACKEVFKAAELPPPPEEEAEQGIQEMEEPEQRPARRPRREEPEDEEEEEERPRRRRRRLRDDDDLVRGRPHRGGLILTLGILGLVLSCCPMAGWILGGIALSMGNTDLQAMSRRQMDRSGQGMTQAGKICGLIAVILATISSVLGIIMRLGGGGKF
jgi:predicted Zn finger-like uncharacterized protein